MSPKSTPLERLNDAAERIRAEMQDAIEAEDLAAIMRAEHKAQILGLAYSINDEGRVTVSRPHREEEK